MSRDFIKVSSEQLTQWRNELEEAKIDYKTKAERLESMVSQIENGTGSFSGTPATLFALEYRKKEDLINVETPNKYDQTIRLIEEEIDELNRTTSNMESNVSF